MRFRCWKIKVFSNIDNNGTTPNGRKVLGRFWSKVVEYALHINRQTVRREGKPWSNLKIISSGLTNPCLNPLVVQPSATDMLLWFPWLHYDHTATKKYKRMLFTWGHVTRRSQPYGSSITVYLISKKMKSMDAKEMFVSFWFRFLQI